MTRAAVAATGRSFRKKDKAFFYLADTVWSALSEAREEEWLEYVRYRSEQGFNVVQISLLPIVHDHSASRTTLFPFELRADGSIDFERINEAYFQRAARMLEQAGRSGLTAALALLWCNYVPDTWISQQSPQYVMPLQAMKAYVRFVVELLDRYQPIYMISGDTDFRSGKTIETYLEALAIVKEESPEALTCLHISPYTDLPEEIVRSSRLDFYMYQSGHRVEEQEFGYALAERFYTKEPARPVVNGEPCYEGHGYGFREGRFSEFSVRKAFWQSVLAGGSAGFTYGAHGVWSWHQRGAAFTNEAWSKTPFDWRTALRFPGAGDVVFGKWLIERYGAFELEPCNELLDGVSSEIRLARVPTAGMLFVYLPYNVGVRVKDRLEGYSFEGVNLTTRAIFYPTVRIEQSSTMIEMAEINSDCLLIGMRDVDSSEGGEDCDR